MGYRKLNAANVFLAGDEEKKKWMSLAFHQQLTSLCWAIVLSENK